MYECITGKRIANGYGCLLADDMVYYKIIKGLGKTVIFIDL
jgi:hypothetical protein